MTERDGSQRGRGGELPAAVISRSIYRAGNVICAIYVSLDLLFLIFGSVHHAATRALCTLRPVTLLSETPWPVVYSELAYGICKNDFLRSYDFWRLWRASMVSTGFLAGLTLFCVNLLPVRRLSKAARHEGRDNQNLTRSGATLATLLFILFFPVCLGIILPNRLGPNSSRQESISLIVLDTSVACVTTVAPPAISVVIAYYLVAFTRIGKGRRDSS